MPCHARAVIGCTLLLVACASPPPLGRHLPADTAAADAAFDQRVQTRFPRASADADLQAEITREGFTVRMLGDAAYGFIAVYDLPGLPCRQTWKVLWSADHGLINAIKGAYATTCL